MRKLCLLSIFIFALSMPCLAGEVPMPTNPEPPPATQQATNDRNKPGSVSEVIASTVKDIGVGLIRLLSIF